MSCENEYPLPLPPQCKPDAYCKTKLSAAKKEGDNKRRFSDRQVKLLKTIFEAEMKIEPMKKVQVARELGLEPKQVSIWFQNRRARWKSKQLEKEYRILKASYETLASQVESLKQEKRSIQAQLQSLSLALQKVRQSANGDANCKNQQLPGQQVKIVRLAGLEGYATFNAKQDYLSVDGPLESSQASTEQEWCVAVDNVNHGFDPPCTQWWEFWNC